MHKIIFIGLFFPLLSFAKGQKFQPVTVPLEPGDRIVVRGYQGDVQILPSSSQELRVEAVKGGQPHSFDRWNFQVRKKKNQVEVVVKGLSEQEDWNKARAKQTPQFNIKVFVPPQPLEVSWYKGNISFKKRTSDVSIQLTEGAVTAEDSQGELAVQLIQGNISIKNHKGNIKLQTYKGSASMEGTQGVLALDNHSSRYQLKKHQGAMEIKNYSGPLSIEEMDGALTLFNRNGVVQIGQHKGSIKGETDKGNINVKAVLLQDFVINSQAGVVKLRLPKESGAFVHLRSEKGGLQAYKYNNYLHKNRKGRWTELKGKLKGEEQGHVKIISKYGNIVLQ